MVARITMVGFGLLASSIAAAIKQAKLPTKIRAVSSPATLKRARELELADEFFEYDETEKWAKDSDLILLCAPILHILKMIDALGKVSWAGANAGREILVSDIGSTKVEICKAGVRLPAPFRFVGSHPMAGSEKRTCEYNDPAIFENAYWFVCPPDGTPESVYAPLLEIIRFVLNACRELAGTLAQAQLPAFCRPRFPRHDAHCRLGLGNVARYRRDESR